MLHSLIHDRDPMEDTSKDINSTLEHWRTTMDRKN